MKGAIPKGGNGARIRPFTYTDVRWLLPSVGKTVSEHALLNLIEIGMAEST